MHSSQWHYVFSRSSLRAIAKQSSFLLDKWDSSGTRFRVIQNILAPCRRWCQSLSNYSFSCTPCRGAFGGKSTAKPPIRQHSHQTKNSYSSRITRHFRFSNKFGFCRLLVLFDCSLLAIVGFVDLCVMWTEWTQHVPVRTALSRPNCQ